MKSLSTLILVALSIFAFTSSSAQNAALRFETNKSCETNEYCAIIQIKSNSLIPIKIGTSSIFFDYNREALDFTSYTSLNFDENNDCGFEGFSPYVEHQYDEEFNGKFNTTITLEIEEAICTEIHDNFMDLAEICFDIVDPSQSSNLVFSEEHTNFNKSVNNGSLIEGIEFNNASDDLDCTVSGINQVVQNDFQLTVNNPVIDIANIKFESSENQELTLELIDITGKKMQSFSLNTQVGTNFESIDMSTMSQGIYIFQLNSKTETSVLKVFKN